MPLVALSCGQVSGRSRVARPDRIAAIWDGDYRLAMQNLPARALIGILKLAIPLAIIAWLLWRMEPEQWHLIRYQPKNYALLVLALAIALGAVALSFARWWVLVRCQGIALSLVEAFRLGSIGFLLSFVSAGSVGGDVFKAVFLAKRCPGKRVEAVASVVVDRGTGLLGLLVMVALAMRITQRAGVVTDPDIARIFAATWVLIAIALVVLAVLIFGGRPIDRFVRHAARWPYAGGVIERVAGSLRMFHSHPFAFGASLLMSCGVHALLIISIYLIARGLYPEPPTLAEHVLIVPLANVASALPIAPAGLGVMEAAMDWLYRVVPEPETEASGTLVALVYELVKVLLAAMGVFFYWSAGRESKKEASESGNS